MPLIDLNGLGHFKDRENAMIASEYSATKTYPVGSYVYYNGVLYRCTTSITTAEAWTVDHWTAAKLADDMSMQSLSEDLKTALLQLASKVAYIDEYGQNYYQDLYDALYFGQSYTVVNELIGCTNSNSASRVYEGASYSATITASDGYTLTGATVSITMGDVDVTSQVYSNGEIEIGNVTGNIVITISAETSIPYPLVNGSHTFTGNTTNGRSITVTNGSHVVYNNPRPSTTYGSGTYGIYFDVTDNLENGDSNNINSPTTPLFTLPSGKVIVMTISNIVWEGLSGGSSVTKYSIGFRNGSTTILTTGDLTPEDTSKTITKSLSSPTNITCGMFYIGIAVRSLEFDVSLTVDGVRWI